MALIVPIFTSSLSMIFMGALVFIMMRMNKTTSDIHTLVNSNMGAQLKLTAIATQRVADLTGTQPDIDAANLARKLLAEHEGKQAIVDKK